MTDSPATFESFGLSSAVTRNECADLIGSSIDGRYTLESWLGEGGFGCVFLARQKSPSRQVAVKVQKYAGLDSHRMAKEADLLARLDDRGIARVFEAGNWASPTGLRLFVAMELIAGGIPLHRFCSHKRLTVTERLDLFCEVCRAVSVAHREGIIHRDLKPGNILVDIKGQPRVIDFGISKLVVSTQELPEGSHGSLPDAGPGDTRFGAFLGTPTYAAPEQQRGQASTRSDVYALGMILKDDLFVDLEGGGPAWLGSLVARCTAGEPAQRPADAAQLTTEIKQAMRWQLRRRRLRIQLAAIAAVLFAGGIASRYLIIGEPVQNSGFQAGAVSFKQPAIAVTILDDGRTVTGDAVTARLATAIGNRVVVSAAAECSTPEYRLEVASSGAQGIAFGGRGSIIATSDMAGWKAWDITRHHINSKPLFNVRADASSAAHDGLIAVSPDGGTLFAQDGPRGLSGFAIRTGARRGRMDLDGKNAATRITSVAATANNDMALIGLSDGLVLRWSLATGRTEQVGSAHGVGAALVAANCSGTRVASCGGDGRVVVLDGQTAAVLCESMPIPGTFTAICFAERDDVIVATRPAGGHDAAVFRLSHIAARLLNLSGSTALSQPVTALAFTGSAVFATQSAIGDLSTDGGMMPSLPTESIRLTAAVHGPTPR